MICFDVRVVSQEDKPDRYACVVCCKPIVGALGMEKSCILTFFTLERFSRFGVCSRQLDGALGMGC